MPRCGMSFGVFLATFHAIGENPTLSMELSQGGFGGMLFRAIEWATREQILRNYELFSRYVAP